MPIDPFNPLAYPNSVSPAGNQNPLMGMNNLFANPLIGAGLSMLGASQARPGNSPYINPWTAALRGGIQSSILAENMKRGQREEKRGEREEKRLGLLEREVDLKGKALESDAQSIANVRQHAMQVMSDPNATQTQKANARLAYASGEAKYLEQTDKTPTTRTVNRGAMQIQEQYDPTTKQWFEVGRGPRWEPDTTEDDPTVKAKQADELSKRLGISKEDATLIVYGVIQTQTDPITGNAYFVDMRDPSRPRVIQDTKGLRDLNRQRREGGNALPTNAIDTFLNNQLGQ